MKLMKLYTRAIYTNKAEVEQVLFDFRAEDLQWEN
jgi:hypothetical protein